VLEHQQAIAPMRWPCPAISTAPRRPWSSHPQYLAPVFTAQSIDARLTESACSTLQARWWRAHRPRPLLLGFEYFSQDALRRANQGEVVIMPNNQDEARARASSARLVHRSLIFMSRFIEPRVSRAPRRGPLAAAQSERLEGHRSEFLISPSQGDTHSGCALVVSRRERISIGVHFAAQLGPMPITAG